MAKIILKYQTEGCEIWQETASGSYYWLQCLSAHQAKRIARLLNAELRWKKERKKMELEEEREIQRRKRQNEYFSNSNSIDKT